VFPLTPDMYCSTTTHEGARANARGGQALGPPMLGMFSKLVYSAPETDRANSRRFVLPLHNHQVSTTRADSNSATCHISFAPKPWDEVLSQLKENLHKDL
jgi:hypothetical protein